MSIEHKDMPDTQRHEPKGISTAIADSAYFSNGSQTGAWRKIGIENFKGLTSDVGSIAGRYVVTDGTGNWTWKSHAAYVQGGFTANSTPFTVVASSDGTLQSSSAYVPLSGTGAPWVNGLSYINTQSSEKFYVLYPGVYSFDFDVNVLSLPGSTSKIGFRIKINGTTFAPQSVITRLPTASLPGAVHGKSLITLNTGEYVQLCVACSDTGNIVLSDITASLEMRRQV
jgi:hypothetical protein